MVEITMGGWGNLPIYRVILTFCFYYNMYTPCKFYVYLMNIEVHMHM